MSSATTTLCPECEGKRHTEMWRVYLAHQRNPQVPWLKEARVRFCPYCTHDAYWREYDVRNS